MSFSPESGMHAQEPVLVRRLAVRGDERAFALPAHENMLGGELVDGLAHRPLAHAEARGELELRGDRLPGFHSPGHQALREQDADLLVERAEGRRRGGLRGHGAMVAERPCPMSYIRL